MTHAEPAAYTNGWHPDDPGLARALDELGFFTTDVKVIGVYPADVEARESSSS